MYPTQCFYFDDLYLLRFGRYVTDVVEKRFFGSVDRRGCSAAQFFEAFDVYTEVLNESYRGVDPEAPAESRAGLLAQAGRLVDRRSNLVGR